MDELEQYWLKFVYDGFPRKFMGPTQFSVADAEEYLTYIWMYNGFLPCYTSVYPLEYQRNHTINKIYIDIDKEGDLDWAWGVKEKIVETIIEMFDNEPRQYFTGNKGFSIYMDFLPMTINNFHFVGRRIVQKLLVACNLVDNNGFRTFDYNCVDPAVLGDISRISRIPYTFHNKTQRVVTPTTYQEPLEQVLCRSENFHIEDIRVYGQSYKLFGNDFTRLIRIIDEIEYPQWLHEQTNGNASFIGGVSWKEDLELLLMFAPFIKDGRKRILYSMIITRLVKLGYSAEAIQEYCQQWIEMTGEEYTYTWRNYVYAQMRNKQICDIKPWSWDALFDHYPDLRTILDEVCLNHATQGASRVN